MTEFVTLSKINIFQKESLHQTQYYRTFSMQLEHIPWDGLEEDRSRGSPFVFFDVTQKKYICYRLLRWQVTDLERSKKKILSAVLSADTSFDNSFKKIKWLTQATCHHNYRIFFSQLPCGSTLSMLKKILGDPTKTQFGIYYYWDSYEVLVDPREERSVLVITAHMGHGPSFWPCQPSRKILAGF